MKHALYILFFIMILVGCTTRPRNFTCYYKNENTGLDKRININGYYVSPHACDSAFFSIYMFYSNGLFTIATTSNIFPELTDCFLKRGTSKICNYPLWGTYCIEGDLIKTQVIRIDGSPCVIFRDYRILPDGNILNVSDYVEPQYTRLGYMANYPSFKDNPCQKKAVFYPLATKRDSADCPFLKKKWFWE